MNTAKKTDKTQLDATVRTELGKKVRALRRRGELPANIYGEATPSKSITINTVQFSKAYRTTGETGVIYISVDKDAVPVLVHHVQKHPVTGSMLHVDFRKVNLNKKIEANVPIRVIGESEAVEKKGGVLLHLAETLTVEALPDKLPSEIEIDISSLADIGAEVTVASLQKSSDFEYKDEPEKVIVRVAEHKEEETAPQVEVEPAAVGEGEESAEQAAEGEAAPEGEAATEEPEKNEAPASE